MALGWLLSEDIFKQQDVIKLFYCPSLDTTLAPVTPWHSMDTNTPNWWNGVGATWWTNPAYASRRIIIGYNYRAPSYFNTHVNPANGCGTHLNTGLIHPGMVLYADSLDPRFGIVYTHRDGYNRLFGDGHGSYFRDPTHYAEQLAGGNCVDGQQAPANDERIFEYLERASGK